MEIPNQVINECAGNLTPARQGVMPIHGDQCKLVRRGKKVTPYATSPSDLEGLVIDGVFELMNYKTFFSVTEVIRHAELFYSDGTEMQLY